MSGSSLTPEARARQFVDDELAAAGWVVQGRKEINLAAGRGIAVTEFPTDEGPADYALYVDGKVIGIIEAKAAGITLSGVEPQADRYARGFESRAIRDGLPFWAPMPPFHYLTTGVETLFQSRLDLISRPREVFTFHRPEHLVSLFTEGSLRQGVHALPPVDERDLRDPQIDAIGAIEKSLREDRPRALVQMTTGAGKTIFSIAHRYRLLRWGPDPPDPVSRRPTEPRHPGPGRVPQLEDPRRRAQARGALPRSAAALQQDRPGGRRGHHHDPAALRNVAWRGARRRGGRGAF